MTFGSLFAGIGGMDLGLERAGMRCAWQVEIDSYAQRVLQKHWPTVPRFGDVRECGSQNLSPVDLIAGGFPCQDISVAGKRAGIDGKRSSLWSEFHRIICELRPRYALVENTAALLGRGIDRVLGDLATSGYDAEWSVVSACAVGAPHTRERLFIVAYSGSVGRLPRRFGEYGPSLPERSENWRPGALEGFIQVHRGQTSTRRIRRNADGFSSRLERFRGIGNAVVPQVAELIGRMIIEFDQQDD